MRKLTVKVNRELVCKKAIRGVETVKGLGLMYVDVFFPDGSQRTCGYIGTSLDGAFAPLHGINAALAELIQAEINKIAGNEVNGPKAPQILPPDDDDE